MILGCWGFLKMAGNNIKVFTDLNFEQEVLKSDKPVLVDFWAEWCAPCRMLEAAVDAVAQEYAERATVGKVNVDENQSITSRYNVRGIPTLLLFKSGQVQEQMVGATSKDAIVKMLQKHV
jgi:thioredoxin 1